MSIKGVKPRSRTLKRNTLRALELAAMRELYRAVGYLRAAKSVHDRALKRMEKCWAEANSLTWKIDEAKGKAAQSQAVGKRRRK